MQPELQASAALGRENFALTKNYLVADLLIKVANTSLCFRIGSVPILSVSHGIDQDEFPSHN